MRYNFRRDQLVAVYTVDLMFMPLYALSEKLGLPGTTSRADLLNAMNGKELSKGVYIGIFGRE